MSEYKVSGTDLTSIADAIRTKGGTSASLSFPDGFVDAIDNIQTGGSSTLITKNITANGTYNASADSVDGYSSVAVDVPSRTIIGTFTGTTAAAAMDVSIPYTGSGYPIAGVIFPSVGSWKSGSDIVNLIQKFVICQYAFAKNDVSATPNYSNNTEANKSNTWCLYKYSNSDASTTTSNRGAGTRNYWDTAATATYAECVRLKNANTMSVYIAGTSYGFAKDIEYIYAIVYSS